MQHEEVDDGLIGVGQGDLVERVGDAAGIGVIEGFPDPVHALAGREHLVADLLEVGEREAFGGGVRPRGGGDRQEEVAQRVIRQLAASGGAELADLGEHERLRGAEGQEVARRGLAAGLVRDRPPAARAAGFRLQLGGKRGVADLVPAVGHLEVRVLAGIGHIRILRSRASG